MGRQAAGKIMLSLTEQEKGTKAKLFQEAMFFVLIFLTQAKVINTCPKWQWSTQLASSIS